MAACKRQMLSDKFRETHPSHPTPLNYSSCPNTYYCWQQKKASEMEAFKEINRGDQGF